jgi:hypothetical protein
MSVRPSHRDRVSSAFPTMQRRTGAVVRLVIAPLASESYMPAPPFVRTRGRSEILFLPQWSQHPHV